MTYRTCLILLAALLTIGCDDNKPKSVTEGADAQALKDYEAELAKVTGQDNSDEGEAVDEEPKED